MLKLLFLGSLVVTFISVEKLGYRQFILMQLNLMEMLVSVSVGPFLFHTYRIPTSQPKTVSFA